ncbi:MAG TPA: HAMP domain-containing sensor histidine kinase [Kofleriaceae bacterium]|nr:HAMP domain-containing sensor histidine kinase [Kofleriaceae bacterium]
MTDEKREINERVLTDASLRSERRKTDAELAKKMSIDDVATDVVIEAREKADTLMGEARALADLKAADNLTARDAREIHEARARADAAVDEARRGADTVARDEHNERLVALARLLATERQDTDLKLELERLHADAQVTTREDFMAIVSHDLRSLLGGIALTAELLKTAESGGDPFVKVKDYAGRIQRFCARMNRLVADLMDVASIEAGKLSLVRKRREVALLLRDATEAFERTAASQGITLTTSCSAPGPIDVDHERIFQVLTNLVGNALKFTPAGGRISIAIDRSEDLIRFTVSDTGEGIPAGILGKIFDRFVQVVENDRRGLGLGLFIAKSIVEAHGGKLWVESTPGKGSTFYFTVAATREALASSSE